MTQIPIIGEETPEVAPPEVAAAADKAVEAAAEAVEAAVEAPAASAKDVVASLPTIEPGEGSADAGTARTRRASILEKPQQAPYKPSSARPAKAPYTPGTASTQQAASLQDAAKQADRPAAAASARAAASPSATAQLTATLPTLDMNTVSGPTGRPIITLSHVTKVYPAQPDKPALNDVSLQIYAGEFIFLVGHSGSGKSTFIRMLTREIKPTSGHIYIADEDLTKMRNWRVPYLRRNVGCVFQDFKLLPNKTVFENVAFALEVIGKSRHIIKTQVPEVLRLVGLQEKMHKMPDQLSGGEQQRVSIARAIVNRPPLLICDEPTGNLDPQTSRGIMDLLERINRTGTTVVVATHDREMVDNMRRRVIVLNQGRLTRDQDRGVYGFDA